MTAWFWRIAIFESNCSSLQKYWACLSLLNSVPSLHIFLALVTNLNITSIFLFLSLFLPARTRYTRILFFADKYQSTCLLAWTHLFTPWKIIGMVLVSVFSVLFHEALVFSPILLKHVYAIITASHLKMFFDMLQSMLRLKLLRQGDTINDEVWNVLRPVRPHPPKCGPEALRY